MLPFLTTRFGNPSSSHPYGTEARAAVEAARRQVAALLGARPEEIVFTSGGTEGNNTVLHGVARLLRAKGRHVVTSAIEHPAVLEPCAVLEEDGCRVTRVPVDGSGRVDPRDVAEALTPETILVSVMHANNEVGTIQDVAEIARLAHERGRPRPHRRGAVGRQGAGRRRGPRRRFPHARRAQALRAEGSRCALHPVRGRASPPPPRRLARGGPARRNGERPRDRRTREGVRGRRATAPARRPPLRGAPRAALRGARPRGRPACAGTARGSAPSRTRSASASRASTRAPSSPRSARRSRPRPARRATPPGSRSPRSSTAMGVPVEYAMGTVRFSVGRGTTPAMVDDAARVVAEAVRRMRPDLPAARAEARERRSREADPLHARDGLRLQAAAAGPRDGPEVAAEGDGPRRPRRPRALRRRGRLPPHGTTSRSSRRSTSSRRSPTTRSTSARSARRTR